jgi:hypothetical protein
LAEQDWTEEVSQDRRRGQRKELVKIGQHDRTVVTGQEAETGNRNYITGLNCWREGFT